MCDRHRRAPRRAVDTTWTGRRVKMLSRLKFIYVRISLRYTFVPHPVQHTELSACERFRRTALQSWVRIYRGIRRIGRVWLYGKKKYALSLKPVLFDRPAASSKRSTTSRQNIHYYLPAWIKTCKWTNKTASWTEKTEFFSINDNCYYVTGNKICVCE